MRIFIHRSSHLFGRRTLLIEQNRPNHSLLCNEMIIKRFNRLLKSPIAVFLKTYFLPTVVVNSWLLQILTYVEGSRLHPVLRLLVNWPY